MNGHARDPQSAIRARLFGKVHIAIGETPLPDDVWSRKHARMLLLLLLSAPEHWLPRDAIIEALWPHRPRIPPSNRSMSRFTVFADRLNPHSAPDGSRPISTSRTKSSGWFLAQSPRLMSRNSNERCKRSTAIVASIWRQHWRCMQETFSPTNPISTGPPRAANSSAGNGVKRCWNMRGWSGKPINPSLPSRRSNACFPAIPTDEAAYYALMSALAAAGRREEALRQFDRCATVLHVELGARPGEETCALAEYIRGCRLPVPLLRRRGPGSAPCRRRPIL